MKNSITVHMIIKNEEQWVWYAVQSVINWVDKIIIYDTGSCDNTVKIIETIKNTKIEFVKKGNVNAEQMVALRNQQIDKTQTDWFLILDGDEVWPEITIKELINQIDQVENNINAIVVPAILPVGDLFHYQSEKAGKYNILGRIGHFNIRCYRKTLKHHWDGKYPLEAYTDNKGIAIQQKSNELKLLQNKYWHMTHLKRSRFSHNKFKLEIGIKQKNKLTEVFYIDRPKIVPNPWVKYNFYQYLLALLLTPMLKIKRNVFNEKIQ